MIPGQLAVTPGGILVPPHALPAVSPTLPATSANLPGPPQPPNRETRRRLQLEAKAADRRSRRRLNRAQTRLEAAARQAPRGSSGA